MSHFSSVECSYLQENEEHLIAALEEQFGKGNVEVHEKGAALYGYQGDNRAELKTSDANYAPPCHIIIRRKNVGSASNDVGFRRTSDGKYAAYISDYDKGSTFSKAKQNLVTQNYATGVTEKQLKKKGYTVKKEKQKDGTIKLYGSKYS